MVGYTSIKTADAEIEGGNGSVARHPHPNHETNPGPAYLR
jgi:hypothetical protein